MTEAVVLAPLAAVAATVTSAGFDALKYNGSANVLLVAATPSAGTDPTLAVKVQHSIDIPHVTSATYTGTGNGHIEAVAGPDSLNETIVFTASSATEFAAVGGTSGALGTATVGTRFITPYCNVLITAGSVAYTATGHWDVITTVRTWADLVTFTPLTDAGTTELLPVNLTEAGRFLRTVQTLGGTDSPSYATVVTLLASE